MGGARENSCSVIEAIVICQEITGRELNWSYSDENRIGDHIWYISSLRKFREHYPDWDQQFSLRQVLQSIFEHNVERWSAS